MISFKKMGIWTELKFLFLPIFSFLPLFSNESETLESCHPISSFLDISKLEFPNSIVCRGSDIEIPYIETDCKYTINNSNVKTKVTLSGGKAGKVISITNLTDSKISVYFKDRVIHKIEINNSSMFLVYKNYDEIVFLPVYIDHLSCGNRI